MNSTELLNEIKNQLELLKHKGYDKNSFKSGYLLGYAKALQLQQTGVSTCFLEDVTDDVFNMGYKQVSCCKIAPITDENYCPKCGKKILK